MRFQIIVTVLCFLYRGTECIKEIKYGGKIAMNLKMANIEERGGRSIRSLLNLKNEEALDHIKRVAEYFENNGPMREVKLREPCKPVKCGQCSTDLCKSRQSNKSPSSGEPILGATMGNTWCPTEILGITHRVKTSPFPKNEIVGSAQQPLNLNNCPKQVITQPNIEPKNYREPVLNIETTLPPTYYNIPPQHPKPSRTFLLKEEDIFCNPPEMGSVNMELSTQPMSLRTAPQNQPVESLETPMQQERTLFGLGRPHLGFGIPLNNLIVPGVWLGLPQLFPKRPIMGTTLPPGLFAHKLPFKLFHRKPHSCTSVAIPQSLSTYNSGTPPSSNLNTLNDPYPTTYIYETHP